VEAMHKAVLDRYEAVYDLTDDWFETATNLATNVIEVYETANRCRIVKLNYAMGPGWGMHSALTPDTAINWAATLPQYDYWQALAARAVLYAANRDPAVRIDALRVEPEAWTATLTGGGTLWHRARDLWGRVYAEGEQPVTGGVVRLPSVPLPPRGIVDLVLKDATGGVLDWFSATVPRVADADIVSIALDRPAWAVGETVSGKVGLRLPSGAPCRLVSYIGDHEGRRLVRAEKPVENGARTAAFAIALPGSSESLLMRVDVQLWQGERLLAERSADCPVPRTTRDGFFAGMSGGMHNRAPSRLMRRMFRDEYGVNMMGGINRHVLAMAARDNIVNFAYATHLGYPGDEASFKPWIENWDTFFPEKLQVDPAKLDAYRSLFLSLGEEHYMLLSGSSHPEALDRFHRHLQERYKNLEELNTVWNAAFKSWDEIPMLKPEMIDVMKFNYGVQAFESRRFMEHLFAQKHAYLADWLRRADPAARVGIHVGWDLWMARGYDFWLLSRGMESMIGYGGVQNQYIRSFFKDYYGSWWHYAIGGHHEARWHPWYMLLSGARGFMWYTMGPQVWGATTGDLQPSSDWKAAAPEFMAAAAAGDLLSRTHYVQDQVAIHYSQDSMHAGMGPALSWLHNNMVNLLFDGGVPFRFLSYDELAQGRAAGVPLLILPGSISLSPGEAEAIRAYVRQGGTVWADQLPGTYDHHGRKLETSQLADLFENLEEQTVPGGGKLQVGRNGRVILAPLDNYVFSRNVGEHLPARALLDEIVRRAGVKRVARALAADGTPANAIWLAGWRQGRQRYLVAAKDYAVADRSPTRADIVFDGPAHVYEGRGGRYLGRHDRISDTFETARGKLYALLPYQVEAFEAKVHKGWLARRPKRGEDLRIDVKLQTSEKIGSDDLHLVRVTVVGPDGMELTALRRKVCVFGGEGVVRLPVAYDDPAGAYTVRLRDTATGLEQTIGYALD
ncbi:MAG: beta-galactosidase, partial [Kiritimatiellae bacterium]|nr:beta-galactosidase [Kiritimatiellia bacterium]